MQLDKLVTYHKALADPTRIRILFLLKAGPLHGQALAGKLGLTPPTITHHMAKLRDACVVKEVRDKNTIYFHLNESMLRQNAGAIMEAFFPSKKREATSDEAENLAGESRMADTERYRDSVIQNFFTVNGRLKAIPAQRKRKLVVFEHLVRELEPGHLYPEKELNDYILQFHDDYCTIRREFIVNHFMYRENNVYEVNPREMWADWRAL